MTDNDSPWKEMLEQELPPALAFFFPVVHTHDTDEKKMSPNADRSGCEP